MDVKQAAEALGISTEGVRQRIRRRSLSSEKDADGRVYVWLDEDDAANRRGTDGSTHAVITRLESEVEYLRAENQRKDAILLSMAEGLKSLEPPTSGEGEQQYQGVATGPEEQKEEQRQQDDTRSWWQRWFGL